MNQLTDQEREEALDLADDWQLVTILLRELVHESNEHHVRVQVFVGRQKGSRGHAGNITLRRDEFDAIRSQLEEDAFGVAAYMEVADGLDVNASERPRP